MRKWKLEQFEQFKWLVNKASLETLQDCSVYTVADLGWVGHAPLEGLAHPPKLASLLCGDIHMTCTPYEKKNIVWSVICVSLQKT